MAAGADGFELDVARCASGEVVVLHDDTVERTTTGSGPVAALRLEELRALDAGAWFAPRFAGQRIPTLQEALDLAAERGARVNIEIKGHSWRGDGLEGAVVTLVRACGLQAHVLISSFNAMALWRMARLAPEIPCGLLYATDLLGAVPRTWARRLTSLAALHPQSQLVDGKLLRWAHGRGYRLNVWTVDDMEEMRRLLALGVDGIITNEPARAVALLR
jgi:glycerophosphoryl diester phosphodiesterase